MNKKLLGQVGLMVGLVVLAAGWRVVNHALMLAPNLELVTAVTLLAAVWLPRSWAAVVPVAVMFGSDAIIGNSPIALFTWSAFILISLVGLVLRRFKADDGRLVLASAGMGLGAAVFFFVWTNFGVWLLGDGTFYAKAWQGLMESYAMGLPFFRATLISGAVVTPVMFAVAVGVRRLRAGGWRLVAARV